MTFVVAAYGDDLADLLVSAVAAHPHYILLQKSGKEKGKDGTEFLLYCQPVLIMEELIEEDELIRWPNVNKDRGLGESWEEIDRAMRKSL